MSSTRKATPGGAAALALAALTGLSCGGAHEGTRAEAEAPPNVLLVTIETLRADHVGALGYERNVTPNLDRLARQGALFRNAVAQAPFTLPSVSSLMTGLTPPRHRVRNHPGRLPEAIVTLAERFREKGYRTAAMTRHTWLRRKSGLDRGFDEYHNNKFAAGLDARSLSLAAVDWLTSRPREDRPFFLWLHFLDPHLPYTPNYPYSTMWREESASDPQVKRLRTMVDLPREDFLETPYADLAGGPHHDLVLPHYPDNDALLDLAFRRRSRGDIFFGKTRYSEEHVAEMRDLYDGAILYTDDNVGRILNALEELALEDSTIVAVASDHGEALGEHELFFTHDFTLYDEVLRVPLVVRHPGLVPAGTIVDQQVRLMDLGPTLLELAGLEPLPGVEAVSLAPLFTGGSLPFLNAFAESAPDRRMFPENDRVFFPGNRGKWRMVRTERFKLIRIPHPDGDRLELYDLVEDPDERDNLVDDLPGEVAKLLPLLDAWTSRDPLRDRETSAEEEDLEGLDPSAQHELRTLGYIK